MEVLRYVAFSTDPAGGNPAGVVLDATGVGDAEMRRTAADIGYSETAFLVPRGDGRFQVRYFSPLAEVPFCGHATIAAAAAYAKRHGPGRLRFDTRSGLVEVSTAMTPDGTTTATLTSVPPQTKPIAADDLAAAASWKTPPPVPRPRPSAAIYASSDWWRHP